MCKVKEVAT